MEIVVAEPEQVDAMVAITEQARANMAAMGIDQWQCGYPDRGTWEADVAAGAAYVALDEGRVVAVFRYADEPEAAYETLEGEWLTDGPYATVHRCAVDPACRGRGIIGELFAFACEKAAADGMASVRIDTHADNAPHAPGSGEVRLRPLRRHHADGRPRGRRPAHRLREGSRLGSRKRGLQLHREGESVRMTLRAL